MQVNIHGYTCKLIYMGTHASITWHKIGLLFLYVIRVISKKQQEQVLKITIAAKVFINIIFLITRHEHKNLTVMKYIMSIIEFKYM